MLYKINVGTRGLWGTLVKAEPCWEKSYVKRKSSWEQLEQSTEIKLQKNKVKVFLVFPILLVRRENVYFWDARCFACQTQLFVEFLKKIFKTKQLVKGRKRSGQNGRNVTSCPTEKISLLPKSGTNQIALIQLYLNCRLLWSQIYLMALRLAVPIIMACWLWMEIQTIMFSPLVCLA